MRAYAAAHLDDTHTSGPSAVIFKTTCQPSGHYIIISFAHLVLTPSFVIAWLSDLLQAAAVVDLMRKTWVLYSVFYRCKRVSFASTVVKCLRLLKRAGSLFIVFNSRLLCVPVTARWRG